MKSWPPVADTNARGRRVRSSVVWYESQKEHWVGWLFHYNSRGAYGRKVLLGRDARFVYNHVVCPGMLLCLAKASGVDARRVRGVRAAAAHGATEMARAAAIRRHIPWEIVLSAMRCSGYLRAGAHT